MMIRQGHRLRVERDLFGYDDFRFYLLDHDENGQRLLAEQIHYTPIEPGSPASAPTFSLHGDAAQQLIDALWQAGLRPTQGRQSEGVTAAQARHLEDMRALAFTKLNVEKP